MCCWLVGEWILLLGKWSLRKLSFRSWFWRTVSAFASPHEISAAGKLLPSSAMYVMWAASSLRLNLRSVAAR